MKQRIYNLASKMLPKGRVCKSTVFTSKEDERRAEQLRKRIVKALHTYRAYGAAVTFFDKKEIRFSLGYGKRKKQYAVTENTFFRSASVSKMVTSMGVLRLYEKGIVDLDEPLSLFEFTDRIVTFKELLSHTSIIQDGNSYNQGIEYQATLSDLLGQKDNYKHKGTWGYSNFGAGLIASLLEEKLNVSFEEIMQETVFTPLSITASFYPPKNQVLSDSYDVFPVRKLSLDAQKRVLNRPERMDLISPEKHFTLAQGNCWLSIDGAFKIAQALMKEGFLAEKTLEQMRTPIASFGDRDKRLSQGLGLFVVDINEYDTFYGHQGLAYGGVHGIFFDPKTCSGFCLLSSGTSLERNGILADINLAFIDIWQEMFHG